MALGTKKIAKSKRDQAYELGRKAWKNRFFMRCPYEPGSELAEIWNNARTEARRLNERPEAPREEPIELESVVELLNKHFRGES